ncbi:MAG: RNA polymerase subunit sigma, partial [Tannerellaceae bacterium]
MEKETLYRYFEGLASPEEEADVYRWLDLSSTHKEELLREREFFDAMILSGNMKTRATVKKNLLRINKQSFV